jgi:hypothetical protein
MLRLQAKWSRKASSPPSGMFRLAGSRSGSKRARSSPTRQLRDALDVGQLAGNGVGTRLDLPLLPPAPASPAAPTREPAPSALGDPIADAIKQERLDQLRRANRREAEEEAARSGKYTDAAEAARQMGVIATRMMAVMEGSLAELATAVSAKFEIPQRDVLHLLRSEFRKVRAAAAKTFRDTATELPPVVNSELADVD